MNHANAIWTPFISQCQNYLKTYKVFAKQVFSIGSANSKCSFFKYILLPVWLLFNTEDRFNVSLLSSFQFMA